MATLPERPDNSKIDYERAGLLEAAIREATRQYGFIVLEVRIRSDSNSAPEIDIELRQSWQVSS